MDNGKLFPDPISKGIIAFASLPSNIYHTLNSTSVPYNIFDRRQITDTSSKDGATLFSDTNNFASNLYLISTFKTANQVEIKLMNLPKGNLFKTWRLDQDERIKKFYDPTSITRPYHPLMLKDSSLVLNLEFEFGLICIDKSNQMKWIDTNFWFHHSIELQDDSTLWTSARGKSFKLYKIDGFLNDAICAIDPRNGKVKFNKSIAVILIENGYQSLLDIYYEDDAIHLNDVQPASSSTKYWEKGDLLISMRNRNTVALYRPSTNKIIWLKTGPWLAQHDCDFVDEKTIMVFGNDILRGKNDTLINGQNDIYFYDFEKNEISKPYNKVMKQVGIKTKTQGRSDLLDNGDLFIDESENGKLYIINKDSLKMIYTERFDKNHIKMFNWVRPILN
jgi:hypothetical protein